MRWATLSIAVLIAAGGCSRSPAPVTASNQGIHAETLAFLDRWNAALGAQDRPAIRAAYTDSDQFQWFEDGILRYESAAEILAALDQFPPGTRLRTTLSNVTTRALSDRFVHASADFQTRIEMPHGVFEFGGVFTMVLERTPGGLVFFTGHTSKQVATPPEPTATGEGRPSARPPVDQRG